jgi:hypothetical protein
MNDEDAYKFHQTPKECAKDLIAFIPFLPGDLVYEPFRGEGAFYDAFPANVVKDWAEIKMGKDFKDLSGNCDWVVSNPPFKLEHTDGKRRNAFWFLLDYYSTRANKGIAFLANDICFSTLTPNRMKLLKDRGWSITKCVVCAVKKWRGRYFFFILQKTPSCFMDFLLTNYVE